VTPPFATTVWVSPSATSFTCLCEPCLEAARLSGVGFADALAQARVRGEVSLEAPHHSVRCLRGHEIVLRRIELPARLASKDGRQLQLT
jgi:hypothetical protein